MTESAVVQLRALRAAIASGQVAPQNWDSIVWIGSTLGARICREVHVPPTYGCRCHDRDWVLAGLDRLIAETEAQEAQHAGE